MSTITLYANKVNQMPTMIGDVRSSVNSLKSELDDLRVTIVAIDRTVCNLDDIINSIRSSSDTQERKADTLNTVSGGADVFIADVVTVDEAAAEAITTGEDDFYDEYPYLKPEDESLLDTIGGLLGDALGLLGDAFELAFDCWCLGWEAIGEFLAPAWEWCKDHWKEIVLTVVIIIGVVLTIVAVVATGGMALVPLLTALGMSMSMACAVSLGVGIAACVFAVGSAVFNIWDTWSPLEGAAKGWQTFFNIGSLVFGAAYSIGNIYSSLHGISNSQLQALGKAFITNKDFRTALSNSAYFRNLFRAVGMGNDKSMLWAGLEHGSATADQIAGDAGRVTLNTMWEESKKLISNPGLIADLDALDPTWSARSIAYAMESSGGINAYLGAAVGTENAYGRLIGDVFINYERVVAPFNPSVSGLTIMQNVGSAWNPVSSPLALNGYVFSSFGRGVMGGSMVLPGLSMLGNFGEQIGEKITDVIDAVIH